LTLARRELEVAQQALESAKKEAQDKEEGLTDNLRIKEQDLAKAKEIVRQTIIK